jgi:DNA-directed RNA polymerase specialized sigma24 family protein
MVRFRLQNTSKRVKMALWIDQQCFLEIGHFTQADREELAKFVHTLTVKASKGLRGDVEIEDIASTCFFGIFKAYNAHKKKLTVPLCYNYMRSELRNAYFSTTKRYDASHYNTPYECNTDITLDTFSEENSSEYKDMITDIMSILTEKEYSIFVDKVIYGFSIEEIYDKHNITCAKKTFYKHVGLIMNKTKLYLAA